MAIISNNDLVRVQIHISPQGNAAVQIVPLRGQLEEHAVEVVTPLELEQIKQVQVSHVRALVNKMMGITMRIFQLQNNPQALNALIVQSKTTNQIMNEDEQALFDAFFPACIGMVNQAYANPLFGRLLPVADRKAVARAQFIPEVTLAVAEISKISRLYLQHVRQAMEAAQEAQALMVDLSMGLISFSREELFALKISLPVRSLTPTSRAQFSSQENLELAEALLEALQNGFNKDEKIGQALLEYLEGSIGDWLAKKPKHTNGKSSETDAMQLALKRAKK